MRIALLLSTAFVTTKQDHPDRERRVQQYVSGLRQVAEVVNQYPCFDVFSIDNTVEKLEEIDSRVISALDGIKTLKAKYHFWDNYAGSINKGSGLIVQWRRVLPELLGVYEFVIHYEPRQHLVDFSFFERMARHPDNYFCEYRDKQRLYGIIPLTLPRFWTGFFSMRTSQLFAYVCAADRGVPTTKFHYQNPSVSLRLRWRLLPSWAAELNECIESDFPRYVKRHRIPIVRISALGSRWHQEANDKWIDMVDRDFVG